MSRELDQAKFDEALAEILDESPASHLLSIPGVYEVLAEHFNNAVLDKLADEVQR